MTILEQFSLFQRIAGSIRTDIEEGKTAKSLGKLEILEGELATLRRDYEELDGGDKSASVVSNDVNFMNKLVKHVIVCKNKIIKYQGSIINAIKEEYIEEPPIYNFVRLANEKGANLEYTLDGKDLLKDIYRSVF